MYFAIVVFVSKWYISLCLSVAVYDMTAEANYLNTNGLYIVIILFYKSIIHRSWLEFCHQMLSVSYISVLFGYWTILNQQTIFILQPSSKPTCRQTNDMLCKHMFKDTRMKHYFNFNEVYLYLYHSVQYAGVKQNFLHIVILCDETKSHIAYFRVAIGNLM